jgi:hypothetical protein
MTLHVCNKQTKNCTDLEKLIVTELVKKLPTLNRNQKFSYRVQKSAPLSLILNQTNPVHTLSPYFCTPILIIYFQCFACCLFPAFKFSYQNSVCSFLFPLIRATYPYHLIFRDLIILIFGEKQKLRSSSLCHKDNACLYVLELCIPMKVIL